MDDAANACWRRGDSGDAYFEPPGLFGMLSGSPRADAMIYGCCAVAERIMTQIGDENANGTRDNRARCTADKGIMFGFLKRAAGIVDDYATGKALEQWYKIAELTTMMYVLKLWDVDSNPSVKDFAINVWSYLLCTEPTDPRLVAFGVQHKGEIESEALRLLASDEPFRKVIVSTMWVGLGVCRSQEDKAGFEKILASEIFKLYSAAYPMLSHDKYAQAVEEWARLYSPPPSPNS